MISLPGAAQETSAKPLNKAEIEQIVKEYILQHPEVLLESVRMHQERERASRQKRSQEVLGSRQSELTRDPSSPATKPTAAVSLVEFFDYRCGYCKRVYPTLKQLLAENADVRLVFKEFPILGPESLVASKAALAAAKQGKYLEFHEAMMTSSAPASAATAEETAKKLGLDVAKLKADMESPEIEAILNRNRELAQSLGVEATPTFVVGSELVAGAIDAAGFQKLIDKAKAGAGK